MPPWWSCPSALPLHRDGQAPIIAIATPARAAALPAIETFIEAGLPGFTAGSYGGLLAPAATPEAIITALDAALGATLAEAAVQARIIEVGGDARQRRAAPAGGLRRLPAR